MQNFETSVAIRDAADTGGNTHKRKIGVVVLGVALILAAGLACGLYFGLTMSKSSSSSGQYGRGAVLNATLRSTIAVSSTLVRGTTLPSSVDWRGNSHAVSAIKNQQQCGCCWAFSTSDAIEAAYGLATSTDIQLVSIQQIVSCDTGNGDQGCNGGDPAQALSGYLSKTALTSANLYPFADGAGTTSSCNTALVAKADSAYSWFPVQVDSSKPVVYAISPCRTSTCAYSSSSEQSLMAALVKGPVSICVDASGWNNYAGGVVDGTGSDTGKTTCTGASGADAQSSAIDHAVSVVGYSTANSVDYWIVRNQWGTSWGEAGYIYLKRGQNTCCILCEAVQTTVIATASSTTTTTTAAPTTSTSTTTSSSTSTKTTSASSSSTTTTAAASSSSTTTAAVVTTTTTSTPVAPACTNPASITNVDYGCYTSDLSQLSTTYWNNYACTDQDASGYVWCCWAPATWSGNVEISTVVQGTTTLYASCIYSPYPTTGTKPAAPA